MPPNVLSDLRYLSSWALNDGATVVQINTHDCPWFQDGPLLRNTLVDGQRPFWDDTANERSDLQVGRAPNAGANYPHPGFGFEFAIRVTIMPTPPYGGSGWRWWLVGPEIHNDGSTGQALFMWEIDEQGRWRVNANAGGASPYYLRVPDGSGNPSSTEWRRPVEVGVWDYFRVLISPHTTATNGRIEVYRRGDLVAVRNGPTGNAQGPGYWKCANYSTAGLNGTRQYEIAGFRVFDGLPDDRSATDPDPEPPPEEEDLMGRSAWLAARELRHSHNLATFTPPATLMMGLFIEGEEATGFGYTRKSLTNGSSVFAWNDSEQRIEFAEQQSFPAPVGGDWGEVDEVRLFTTSGDLYVTAVVVDENGDPAPIQTADSAPIIFPAGTGFRRLPSAPA